MTEPLHDDIDNMEGYVQGTLSAEERAAFESRLKTDLEFQKAFDAFRVSYSAIILESRRQLKQRLQQEEEKSTAPRGKIISWRYVSIGIAASIILAVLFIQFFQSPSTDELYTSYYRTYPNVVAPIERNGATDDPFKKAFQLYESERYTDALVQLRVLLKNDSTSPALNLYAGLCALALHDASVAISYFDTVIEASPNDFIKTATWYIALAYLKNGNKEKTIFYLNQLSDDQHYQQRAKDLIDELN